MEHRRRSAILLVAAWTLVASVGAAASEGDDVFERAVRPVLAGTCFRCHGGDRTSGGLRVDSRAALLKGGETGPVLVPGAPDDSLLIQALRYHDDAPHMPPQRRLAKDVVRSFENWVSAGAPWPETTPRMVATQTHWAFAPLKKIEPPAEPAASSSPIDRFLAARQRAAGVSTSARADNRTWLRRLTFDLIGLPPTPEEMAVFVADDSAEAVERVVDRLLASPRYGERWGRHWLDVVRYADTAGETADFPAPQAWRYRNYVIDAFNRDMPFDQFLREQVAGDILAAELPHDAPAERFAELVTATGYLAVARRFGFDIAADHYLTIDDTIDVLGKSVLGLTIACARCHDHKYDPIAQADYYSLFGVFASTRYPYPGCEKEKRSHDLVPLVRPDRGVFVGPIARAYAVAEGPPINARIHLRGDPATLGPEVPRRALPVFGAAPATSADGSGRRELAEWFSGPAAPLVARVFVNRVWRHHFGEGLVATPDDFGTRGSAPSHPELLDWLAARLIRGGWSIKTLHREMVRTDAYRRASACDPASIQADPGNVFLGRFSRRRLSAEEIRDAILALSGELDPTPGGPHPFPPESAWGYTQHTPFEAGNDQNRRSVYILTARNQRHPFLALFDGADPNTTTGRRHSTTVPTQALFFLNDPFVHSSADALARRLFTLPDDRARLDRLFALTFGRAPTDVERRRAARFLDDYARDPAVAASPRLAAWAAWSRVVMIGNEFLYID